MLIDKETFQILDKKIILQLPTHLSFPIFIKDAVKTYVYPENYQSGSLKIYEYSEKQQKLVNPKVIINEPLLDTQIFKLGDVYYAFGVKYRTGLQTDTKILSIYQSEDLTGPYKMIQQIENAKCEERGAGLIFTDNRGRIVRPAQCCEGGYGKSVIFYELIMQNGIFTEKELSRLEPDPSALNGNVLHTFNRNENICVIDGLRVFHPLLGKIYKKIRHIPE